jgi:hypothetical protein
MTLDLTVNTHIRTNIGLHIIYDDNIKAKEEIDGVQEATVGPKTQLKQVLVGAVYEFLTKKVCNIRLQTF